MASLLGGAIAINVSATLFSRKDRLLAELATARIVDGPSRKRMGPWTPPCRLLVFRSGGHPARLFHDREAHSGLVTVLFRHRPPGFLGLGAALERALNLGRSFHQLVEVHRTELPANHPEIAADRHDD